MDFTALLEEIEKLPLEQKVSLVLKVLGALSKGGKKIKHLFTKKQKQELEKLVRVASEDETLKYASHERSIREIVSRSAKSGKLFGKNVSNRPTKRSSTTENVRYGGGTKQPRKKVRSSLKSSQNVLSRKKPPSR
jgi:hypothetical protein